MLEVLQAIALAAVMFSATDADDLVRLSIFFAQPGCRPRAVVMGQLAGIRGNQPCGTARASMDAV